MVTRIYLETTALAAFTYFKDLEKDRYKSVSALLEICKKEGIEVVVSFYTLHEIFLMAFDYLGKSKARKIGKNFMLEILSIKEVEIAELLPREKKIVCQSRFRMKNRTDIPHAISAFLEKCWLITYDTHFNEISNLMKVLTPEDFIEEMTREK